MSEATGPSVILSGFADEAANHKTPVEQFSAFAALGLNHYTIRFVDTGGGVKNVMDLEAGEIAQLKSLHEEYGMRVASIGSPIGKVKLLDVEDGTTNRFVPFEEYLGNDVQRACDLASAFETKLIRGFSFYPPKNDEVGPHLNLATDQIGQIVDRCAENDCIFGLEVEANLVGRNGSILKDVWQAIDHPNLVLIYDAANLLSQGYTAEQSMAEFRHMRAGLGWIHVKDYLPPAASVDHAFVDEEALSDFRPVDQGSGVYQELFAELRDGITNLSNQLVAKGVPGLFVELEPHIKGGGQFGGFSGPDGMGVAVRAVRRMLDDLQIGYDQRQFSDTQVRPKQTSA